MTDTTQNFLSRIARHCSLRRLEAVAILTTALAFAITVLLVTTGRAVEVNPVAAGLLDAFGWSVVGVFAIGVEKVIRPTFVQ